MVELKDVLTLGYIGGANSKSKTWAPCIVVFPNASHHNFKLIWDAFLEVTYFVIQTRIVWHASRRGSDQWRGVISPSRPLHPGRCLEDLPQNRDRPSESSFSSVGWLSPLFVPSAGFAFHRMAVAWIPVLSAIATHFLAPSLRSAHRFRSVSLVLIFCLELVEELANWVEWRLWWIWCLWIGDSSFLRFPDCSRGEDCFAVSWRKMATSCGLAGGVRLPLAALSTVGAKRIDSSSSSSSSSYGASFRVPGSSERKQQGRKLAADLIRCDASPAAEEQEKKFDSKEFRKTLTRGENYNRSGFGYKKEMLQMMDVEYTS